MYCPVCGAESTTGLNYCKRCGASLSAQATPLAPGPSVRPTGAAWAVSVASVLISIVGFLTVFLSANELAGRSGVEKEIPIVMVIFGSATLFGIIALLINVLSRLVGLGHKAEQPSRRSVVSSAPDYPAQIPAPPSTLGSVTEHTTRTFDRSEHSRVRE